MEETSSMGHSLWSIQHAHVARTAPLEDTNLNAMMLEPAGLSVNSHWHWWSTRRGGEDKDGRMPETFAHQHPSTRRNGCGALRKGSSLGRSRSGSGSSTLQKIGRHLAVRVAEWKNPSSAQKTFFCSACVRPFHELGEHGQHKQRVR